MLHRRHHDFGQWWMAFGFILFVFIGLHLFFLSIEIGWKHLRLRYRGQQIQAIVDRKQFKPPNKHYLFYQFMTINMKQHKNYVITQRVAVTKFVYSDYTEGDLIPIIFIPQRPQDNMMEEEKPNTCCCILSIFMVLLCSIIWMVVPFIWRSITSNDNYTVDYTALATFGVAFCLWAASRFICWKCWKSTTFRKREANEYDLRQFAAIRMGTPATSRVISGLNGTNTNTLSSAAATNLFHVTPLTLSPNDADPFDYQ
eukprot:305778_1